MATTRNLQATIQFASPIMRYNPLVIAGTEPAVTAANITMQTMLGPPMAWPWNRNTFEGDMVEGEQDLQVVIADFGFMEKFNIEDTAGKSWELQQKGVLAMDGSQPSRSQFFAHQLEAEDGTMTFRLSPPADSAYPCTGIYQMAAPTMSSPASSWAPIPDRYQYISDYLFLGLMAVLMNDPRWQLFNQKAIAHLLGAQQGLSEQQKNLFLEDYARMLMQIQGAGLKTQQGYQGRSV